MLLLLGGMVSSFWGGVFLFSGGSVVCLVASLFLLQQQHFWVASFPAAFVWRQCCIAFLQQCCWALFGGWHFHFGGGLSLFWQMQCCLFGGHDIMVRM